MPFKLCVPNKGILGEIKVSPQTVKVKGNVNSSSDISISLQSSSPVQNQVIVSVTVVDEFGNNIDGLDFQFKKGAELKHSIQKDLLNNNFSYIVEKVPPNSTLTFKIVKTQPILIRTKCFINVDATSSGFGAGLTQILFEASPNEISPDGSASLLEDSAIPEQQNNLINSITYTTVEQEDQEVEVDLSDSGIDGDGRTSETLYKPLIEGEYNFYISRYEKLIASEDVHENIIPSVNYLYVEPKIMNFDIRNIRTLNGLLDGRSNSRDLSIKPKIIKDFFEEYTVDVSYQTKIKSKLFNNLKTQKICLFPSDYNKILLQEVEKYRENFPMIIKFNIFADSLKSQLNSLLKEIGMLDYFCYCLISELTKNVATINLGDFLKKYFSENSKTIVNTSSILYLGNISKNISKFNIPTSNSFIKAIMSKVFLTKIASNPEITKQEVMLYEIVKSYNGKIISKNYFINDFEANYLKFYDTQVKYDKLYKYDISRYVLKNSQFIGKEKILSTNVKVYDLPPVQPDTTYVQYKGEDNKLLINLNSGIGKYNDYPVEITENDKLIFDVIQKHQDKKDEEKIKFQSDDPVSEFEIMRIDFEPKNFQDFKNAKSVILSTKIDGEVKFNASSYVDDIEPNKKYYYITRSKDVHGNISNPTTPIQIEMINQNGTIFLNKKEYTFKTIPKVFTKDVKKFIEIKVADEQSVMNPKSLKNNAKSAFDLKNIKLGNKDLSVWEKTFLMRVTSKLTGKKVDVKFKFNFTQPPIRERKPKS
jgi:hypothetical protein